MIRSLRQRLTFTHTLIALAAVLIMALLSSALLARAYDQLSQRQALQARASLVGVFARLYLLNNQSWDGIGPLVAACMDGADPQAMYDLTEIPDNRLHLLTCPPPSTPRLIVSDAQGIILYDTIPGFNRLIAPGLPLPGLLRNRDVTVPVRVPADVDPARLRAERAERAERQQPDPPPPRASADMVTVGFVSVPAGLQFFNFTGDRVLINLLGIGLLGSLFAGGAAVLVAWLVSRSMTAPLQAFTRAARRLAAGERYEPLVPPTDMELAELAQAFNTMAAELERQEFLRRQLVADIAHELRTPLSVLQLQVESLEDGISQPTPETLNSLTHEVGLLTGLVNDLRLLSLADAGQLPMDMTAVDAREMLERAAAGAAPRARQQQIDLRIEPPPAHLPPVQADQQRLAQVLGNLVENALRYTPPGGRVRLRVRDEQAGAAATPDSASNGHTGQTRLWRIGTRRLSPASTGHTGNGSPKPNRTGTVQQPVLPDGTSWLVFEVSDTGPGIAPEDLPYIFDRFYRADRARTREKGGSGLGLAIVQRLVEAQAGRVDVQSVVGRGTTFRVRLPVASSHPLPQVAV